jgi:hypothetical protein
MMSPIKAEYRWRGHGSGGWGDTVCIVCNKEELYRTIDPDKLEEVINWADQHSHARRISYDTWKFDSVDDARKFMMLFTLTWG